MYLDRESVKNILVSSPSARKWGIGFLCRMSEELAYISTTNFINKVHVNNL